MIHRDVKPENVMLGDFGEVHLMDWGLARVERGVHPSDGALDLAEIERISTARTDTGSKTEHGILKGTVPYMAPEQVTGPVDRRTDVYALGCVLYEVLALQPAYDAHGGDLLRRVMDAAPPPVETRNPRRTVPAALAEICRKAMAKDPVNRYQTAQAMGQVLRAWLDGTSERDRRHEEAEALAKKGREAAAGYERRKAEILDAEAAVEVESAKVKPWQPISEKRSLLDARKKVEDLSTEVALAFAETVKLFDAALAQEEKNVSARAALASLWKGRLEEAERKGERADIAYALTMVRRYDDGALAAFVKGDGSLTLVSEPTGAEVAISRFVERDGVVVPEETRSLGRTPLAEALPMGSYLCVLKKSGYPDVRYPGPHLAQPRVGGPGPIARGGGDRSGVRVRSRRAICLRRGEDDADDGSPGLRDRALPGDVWGVRAIPGGRGAGRGSRRGGGAGSARKWGRRAVHVSSGGRDVATSAGHDRRGAGRALPARPRFSVDDEVARDVRVVRRRGGVLRVEDEDDGNAVAAADGGGAGEGGAGRGRSAVSVG